MGETLTSKRELTLQEQEAQMSFRLRMDVSASNIWGGLAVPTAYQLMCGMCTCMVGHEIARFYLGFAVWYALQHEVGVSHARWAVDSCLKAALLIESDFSWWDRIRWWWYTGIKRG